MWSSKRSAAPAHIRRLCTLGLPLEAVVPALMHALCREAHCDAGVVLWFDARGEISNLYARNMPAPAARAAWFRPVQQRDAAARRPLTVAGPAHRSRIIETCADDTDDRVSVETRVEPFCPHRHLCSMAAPDGAPTQRLCCAVLRHGVPVASLMLYRSAATPPFGGEERIAVKAAGRYLSLNGRSTPVDTSPAMYRASGVQGFLLCEPDGRVIRASTNGYELLAQACGCPVNRATVAGELERAGRQLIRRLFAETALHSAQDAAEDELPISLINPWGLFRLRVFLDSNGPQAVLIERVEHLLVRLVEGMWHLDLSVQQGEVLLLLAQGLSHDRIAERMGVSPNTADYHIRQLYSKLSAHTRDDAIAYALGTLETAHAA
jgi:DNA-binding CsgD family transcriptional regulator